MHGLTGGSWKRNTDRARVTEMKDTRGNPAVTAAPRPTVDPRHRASSRPYVPVGFGGAEPGKPLSGSVFGFGVCLIGPCRRVGRAFLWPVGLSGRRGGGLLVRGRRRGGAARRWRWLWPSARWRRCVAVVGGRRG